jgi:hypothetical protein
MLLLLLKWVFVIFPSLSLGFSFFHFFFFLAVLRVDKYHYVIFSLSLHRMAYYSHLFSS